MRGPFLRPCPRVSVLLSPWRSEARRHRRLPPPALAAARCGEGGIYVKRLIGLPGEVWEERGGYVFINGRRLDEQYIRPERRDSRTIAPITIPRGRYFMMGDNRISSCDSRRWGAVARASLIGKVIATYWPPGRISCSDSSRAKSVNCLPGSTDRAKVRDGHD